MLEGKELKMYQTQNKKVRVICKNGDILEGYCSEFSSAYDNEPEEASITLRDGRRTSSNKFEALYILTEIYESEIEEIEYLK